jgi:hypothetical protein
MSITYSIDQERHLVRSRGWGVISTEDLNDWIGSLLADRLFRADFRSLIDLSLVTDITVDAVALARAASTPLFDPGVRRAIVATSDSVFGVARMFASYAERIGQVLMVFRELWLAEEWLGLDIFPGGALPPGPRLEPVAA